MIFPYQPKTTRCPKWGNGTLTVEALEPSGCYLSVDGWSCRFYSDSSRSGAFTPTVNYVAATLCFSVFKDAERWIPYACYECSACSTADPASFPRVLFFLSPTSCPNIESDIQNNKPILSTHHSSYRGSLQQSFPICNGQYYEGEHYFIISGSNHGQLLPVHCGELWSYDSEYRHLQSIRGWTLPSVCHVSPTVGGAVKYALCCGFQPAFVEWTVCSKSANYNLSDLIMWSVSDCRTRPLLMNVEDLSLIFSSSGSVVQYSCSLDSFPISIRRQQSKFCLLHKVL